MKVFPDNLLVGCDFKKLRHVGLLLRVAANDRVSVGQALGAARICKATADVFVGHFPNNFAVGIELNGFVSVSQIHQGISVFESNRRERPVLGFASAEFFEIRIENFHDRSVGLVFFHGKSQEVRDDVVAVGKFARHSGLHVAVVGIGLKWDFDSDFSIGGDFK